MSNYLRKLVSGKRRRLKKDGIDLDITYITKKVLAMSYPASGFESLYRNSISDVTNYLDREHPDHYKVYNMSNREYKVQAFERSVDYKWEDHHSPCIDVLFQACDDMLMFL